MEAFNKADKNELELPEFDMPPELPPPLDEHLIYDQLATELMLDPSDNTIEIEHIDAPELDTVEAQDRLQEIIEAADEGQAIEGELEKSHEIKGDQAAQGAFAASVGQVLAQIHRQTQAAYAAFQDNQPVADGPISNVMTLVSKLPYARNLSPMYQRALIGGIIGGVFVVLIWMLVALRPGA